MSDFKVGFESTEIKFFFNILQNITLILDTVSDSRVKRMYGNLCKHMDFQSSLKFMCIH